MSFRKQKGMKQAINVFFSLLMLIINNEKKIAKLLLLIVCYLSSRFEEVGRMKCESHKIIELLLQASYTIT